MDRICFALLGALLVFGIWLFFANALLYADIYRALPFVILCLFIVKREWIRLLDSIIALVVVVVVVMCLKYGFSYLAHRGYEEMLNFCKRPINGDFNGFPSGHSALAFLAVALSYYHDLNRSNINGNMKYCCTFMVFILAALVSLSRVITLWHSPLQAICGALLGLFLGFISLKILKRI